ncbi:helix-turn-helix domain-containing protein [Deinococcus sp.]|uniref:helix-turn-helix domain-containing protein n=1 Tax=Deinococcus sp. TaxID=47478 RepID=UPI003CC6356B
MTHKKNIIRNDWVHGVSSDKEQERAAQLAQLAARMRQISNEDGTITPSERGLSLLTEESAGGLEQDYLEALVADTLGEGLRLVRAQSPVKRTVLLGNVSKVRLSQLEHASLNPRADTLVKQADALEYDVSVMFTPRRSGKPVVVPLKP